LPLLFAVAVACVANTVARGFRGRISVGAFDFYFGCLRVAT
jgi:hypothetical protein